MLPSDPFDDDESGVSIAPDIIDDDGFLDDDLFDFSDVGSAPDSVSSQQYVCPRCGCAFDRWDTPRDQGLVPGREYRTRKRQNILCPGCGLERGSYDPAGSDNGDSDGDDDTLDTVLEKIDDVWGDQTDYEEYGLEYVVWLITQDIYDVLDDDFEESETIEELCDIAINALRALDEHGYDPRERILERLDDHGGKSVPHLVEAYLDRYERSEWPFDVGSDEGAVTDDDTDYTIPITDGSADSCPECDATESDRVTVIPGMVADRCIDCGHYYDYGHVLEE